MHLQLDKLRVAICITEHELGNLIKKVKIRLYSLNDEVIQSTDVRQKPFSMPHLAA